MPVCVEARLQGHVAPDGEQLADESERRAIHVAWGKCSTCKMVWRRLQLSLPLPLHSILEEIPGVDQDARMAVAKGGQRDWNWTRADGDLSGQVDRSWISADSLVGADYHTLRHGLARAFWKTRVYSSHKVSSNGNALAFTSRANAGEGKLHAGLTPRDHTLKALRSLTLRMATSKGRTRAGDRLEF
ncbi:hypothetical protein R1flu_007027 [Riccia fluitans]|uniref:Uncharacterized protein n=1 Tax=Riccia fluitans TaxID=41844 RepID=A0ABD1YXW8_9MARC